MKAWFLAGLMAAATIAAPASASMVETTFSGTLDQAFGVARVGELFLGHIRYDDTASPVFVDPEYVEYAGGAFDFEFALEDGTTLSDGLDFSRIFYSSSDSRLSIGGLHDSFPYFTLDLNLGRSDQFNTSLPNLAEILYRPAAFSFFVSYSDDTGPRPTGGSGTAIIGTVPEPATWALMIGGFLLVGGTVRRRKRQSASA